MDVSLFVRSLMTVVLFVEKAHMTKVFTCGTSSRPICISNLFVLFFLFNSSCHVLQYL